MNYNSFFGFSDSPFLDDLDQRFLFLSKQFKTFLEEISDFASEHPGIAVVSGDEGVGKTMLVQALLEKLPSSFQPLIITKPAAEPLAITLMLAQTLNITLRHRNLVNLTPLADAIKNAAQEGKFFFLIIDEAHYLTDQHLEEIYVLSQMEHQGRQLMPILLVGRKGLVQKLASQTNQRLQGIIRHNLALTGLTFEETIKYIDHRLYQVGSSYKACFAEGCSGQLFSRTGGVPLRINEVCDQALNRAWQENQPRVTRDLIGGEELVPASYYKPLVPTSRYGPLTKVGAWAAAALLAGLVGYVMYNNFYSTPMGISPSVANSKGSPSKITPAKHSVPPVTPAPEKVARTQPPETVVQTPVQETATPAPPPEPAEGSAGSLSSMETAALEPQASQEFEPLPVLPRAESQDAPSLQETQAESLAVSPQETTTSEAQTPRPETHRVVPVDGGLLRIVAGYYPEEQEIGYNAVILANKEIINEDIIYPGQKLSLPKVDKNHNVITLGNNQHFSIYKQYFSASQVEQATARLQDQGIRYVVRETRLPGAGPIYRIFLGGYESPEKLEEARAAAEQPR